MATNVEKAMQRLRVGALEDITDDELRDLIAYIEQLEEIKNRYEYIMNDYIEAQIGE